MTSRRPPAGVWSAAALLVLLAGCRAPAPVPPNVILISIDTLRADHLGTYGYPWNTSPEIDRFADESVVFENAYSQAVHTLASHASLLTSLHPETHGVLGMNDSLSPGVTPLAEILSRHGYETAAFVNAGWLHPKFGLGRGFEAYDYYDDLAEDRSGAAPRFGRDAAETNRAVFSWLAAPHPRPFLLFVHYFDVHSDWARLPYDSPAPWGTMFCPDCRARSGAAGDWSAASLYLENVNATNTALEADERRELAGLYDGGIAYTDHHVGELLRRLAGRGLLDRSIVVLTADHGEEFQEHGRVLHVQVYEPLIHVPLIVRLPRAAGERSAGGRRIVTPVRSIDVSPTILESLGITIPPEFEGRSLLGPIAGRDAPPVPVVSRNASGSQYALIEDGWKLVRVGAGETAPSELYEIRADPAEGHDLASARPEIVARLSADLLRWRSNCAAAAAGGLGAHSVELDDRTREGLRALGYAD